jgi:hypothetical protein
MKVFIGLVILVLMICSAGTDKEKARRAAKAQRKKQAKAIEKAKQEAINRALEIAVAFDDD